MRQRLIDALLADIGEKWLDQNRYFDTSEHWDWKQTQEEQNAEALHESNVIILTE